MRGIVDRFEGDYTVIEFEDEVLSIKTSDMPKGIKEGDAIVIDDCSYISIDTENTNKRKDRINDLLKELGLEE